MHNYNNSSKRILRFIIRKTNSLIYRILKLLSKTPLNKIPVKVQSGTCKGLWWSLFPCSNYWKNGWEEIEIRKSILNLINKESNFWDLGTHFGIYTLGVANILSQKGQVVGIEPDPYSFRKCKYHVKLNSFKNIRLFNAAASDSNGYEALLDGGHGSTTSHIRYNSQDFEKNYRNKVLIKKITLDEILNNLDINPPTLLKVDIEGHGHKALRGASTILKQYKPAIIISFHNDEEFQESIHILKNNGYDCFNYDLDPIEWPTINKNQSIVCI